MKYDKQAFDLAVKYYKKELVDMKGKTMLVLAGINDEKAFYSIAPLSKAVHEKGGDIHIIITDENNNLNNRNNNSVEVLFDTWEIYRDFKEGINNNKTKAFKKFYQVLKQKSTKLTEIFIPPEYIIRAEKNFFVGNLKLDYQILWLKKYRTSKLLETSEILWEQLFNLKKYEKVGIGFETIPKKCEKLEDYLDSYQIARNMIKSVIGKCKTITVGAASSKKSVLVDMERISNLRATLMGCELSTHSSENIFKKYKILRKFIGGHKLKSNDAVFSISGSSYAGKHHFGQEFGYPAPKNKTRWQSPGQILYKLDYFQQTKDDPRKPSSRIGFTSTIPIDIFIKSNLINWLEMKKKNDKLKKIFNNSNSMVVESKIKNSKTNFKVFLNKPDGTKRLPKGSDTSIRSKLNNSAKKRGVLAGNMANIPGGETFITPEFIRGTFAGDVVINIGKSMKLSNKKPLIINCNKKGYRVIDGPKKVIDELTLRKAEAKKQILNLEKNKSFPKKIIKLQKENFNKIGEFAINTNPHAELCDYLIVNEKIAGMIHIALGSGFESDRATTYHYDIVINAKKQKLNIYGLDNKKNKIWAMKEGKLLF